MRAIGLFINKHIYTYISFVAGTIKLSQYVANTLPHPRVVRFPYQADDTGSQNSRIVQTIPGISAAGVGIEYG